MTLIEAIEQLTQLHAQYGDLPVLHEGFDEGPDENCIVRLQPVTVRGVASAEDYRGRPSKRLFFELLDKGTPLPISSVLGTLKTLAEQQPLDLELVVEAGYGYIDEVGDIYAAENIDQIGPFFEEDVVDIPASQFPCALVQVASAI